MKFFQRPANHTVRKKFCWLPKRVVVTDRDWKYKGEPAIPFTPNWQDDFNYGVTTKPNPKHCGGVVVPVQGTSVVLEDSWFWLEWCVEVMQITERDDGYTKTGWRPMPLPKQWTLFYEYY